jgi:8-oxo-dGTP pyrophosphatase MutT (NUDIX family)
MEPHPASSVLLVRDTPSPEPGVDVFMAQRHVKSAFVGGAYVFPGGRVDPEDALEPALLAGLDETDASRRLGLATGGLAHYVAAIRESFEEVGVLLAYDRTGALLDLADPARAEHFERLRHRLNAGETTIAEIARGESLRLAVDRLEYWSHWITPLGEPRRFDTRFFIARAPERQVAAHDRYELTGSAWVSPVEAIARALRHEWMVIFPTLMNLKELGRHRSVDDAMAWAHRQPRPLPANQPRILRDRVVLPGDEGYDEAALDISGVDPGIFERSFQP